MTPSPSTQSKKSPVVRDLSIIGDFIKYFLLFFIPFVLVGIVFGLINHSYFMCMLGYPFIYAWGFASIVIVINHDINDILALIGLAKQPQLALHIKHANTIQQISIQMSSRDYDDALKTVNKLLREEPAYSNALNLKGQILLEGFREADRARSCFEKVLKLARPGSEDYKLAQALRAASYKV